ncbi:hypothetical protein RHMOL_Rhmol03G0279900 [Rhododendron molle]|uniref:Uncharacterized protein n=1 Tax=Rhododendron molle TaxID=49168 RepID=A0ACC0PKM9_RHOML|nr:hypothetical protein RHMOL_Rhmol03G0279900 [Rhododendron molle]
MVEGLKGMSGFNLNVGEYIGGFQTDLRSLKDHVGSSVIADLGRFCAVSTSTSVGPAFLLPVPSVRRLPIANCGWSSRSYLGSPAFCSSSSLCSVERRDEAINAIEDLDGVVIRNFPIVVQFAKYTKDNPFTSQKHFDGVKKFIRPLLFIVGNLNPLSSRAIKELLIVLPMQTFIKGALVVLSKWFSSVQAWDNQKIPPSRCVWISCYGVPLNAWCSPTFIEIGKLWGDVIKLDELTEKSIAFDKGRMFIITDYLDCINEVVHIKINGVIFPVKVIEDPMAKTSWEKRVFTSIKIKKGNDKEEKEALVEVDPEDDESLDFDVDKAELGNEMDIVEEVAETNVEAEKAIGTEERALQLINVNTQGCHDKAAHSSSAWGSGKVMDSMREMTVNNTTLNTNLDPLSFVRLNTCIQIPRASLSNLVDNQDSWMGDSVKENTVIAENLRGENNEDDIIPGHHIEAYRTENEPLSAPIKAAINGVKGKKKRKTIDDILGFTRVSSFNNKSRNNKPKCAVYRSAVAALALSASLSSDRVINRNRIILDKAQAIWTYNKIIGLGNDGEEDEVISKLADMVAEDLVRADKVTGQA